MTHASALKRPATHAMVSTMPKPIIMRGSTSANPIQLPAKARLNIAFRAIAFWVPVGPSLVSPRFMALSSANYLATLSGIARPSHPRKLLLHCDINMDFVLGVACLWPRERTRSAQLLCSHWAPRASGRDIIPGPAPHCPMAVLGSILLPRDTGKLIAFSFRHRVNGIMER